MYMRRGWIRLFTAIHNYVSAETGLIITSFHASHH